MTISINQYIYALALEFSTGATYCKQNITKESKLQPLQPLSSTPYIGVVRGGLNPRL